MTFAVKGRNGMRLIDGDKLYRRVKTECNPYGNPCISFEDGNRVMKWIEDAPTVGGWISVKDRLPDADGLYITCDGDGNVDASFYNEYPHLQDGSESHWFWHDDIVYWMDLPEPPKEEHDEN